MNLLRRVLFSAALLWLAALPAVQAGVAARVNQSKVNVRGQPSFLGEVITQIQKGEEVIILEEVPATKLKPGEPTNWAKIKMPANTPVWVFANFLDGSKVKARKLNLRAGPGENYSIVGRLEKGAEVKPIRTVDEWVEIETPDQAYAYLDASLLDVPNGSPSLKSPELTQPVETVAKSVETEKSTSVVQTPPAESATSVKTTVAEEKPVSTTEKTTEQKTTEVVQNAAPAAPSPANVAAESPAAVEETAVKAAAPAEEKIEKTTTVVQESVPADPQLDGKKLAIESQAPPPVQVVEKVQSQPAAPAPVPESLPVVAQPVVTSPAPEPVRRIVRREGIVRTTRWNIQAPTYYELQSSENGTVLNFLHAEKSDIKLKDYLRRRVVVTGEESLDPRFEKVPVLELETLEAAP